MYFLQAHLSRERAENAGPLVFDIRLMCYPGSVIREAKKDEGCLLTCSPRMLRTPGLSGNPALGTATYISV